MVNLDRIVTSDLCLGCGMCKTLAPPDSISMELKDGFFRPKTLKKIESETIQTINKICPGLRLENTTPLKSKLWGNYEGIYSAFYTNEEVRDLASSGGIISGMAIELLKSKSVDGIMQVASDTSDYTKNKITISKTRQDVLNAAGSRYAPSLIFDKLIEILESSSDIYCFIGKPCDISALENFLNTYKEFNDRFFLKISIFCAGMPSFRGTSEMVKKLGAKEPINSLKYRGEGWPGYFSFKDNSGKRFTETYNNSWGKVLNRHLHPRCKICPDGIGIQADISIGDAWETEDGYPSFSEKKGLSLVITRNKKADTFFKKLESQNKIESSTIPLENLKKIQPYQYNRRKVSFWRSLAFMIKKGIFLRHIGFGSFALAIKNSPIANLKEFAGSLKRF